MYLLVPATTGPRSLPECEITLGRLSPRRGFTDLGFVPPLTLPYEVSAIVNHDASKG